MKPKLYNIRTVLLCSLGAFGAGISLCRAMGYGPEGAPLFLLSALGAGIMAHGTLTRFSPALVLGAISDLTGIILCGVFHGDAAMGAFAAVAAALSILAVRLCGFGFHGGVGAWCLALSFLGMLFTMGCGTFWQILSGASATLSLGLLLEGMRYGSLRKGHIMKDTVPPTGKGQSSSIAMFVLFLCGAVPVGLLFWGLWSILGEAVTAALRDAARGAGGLLAAIARAIEAFYIWLLQFFRVDPPTGGNGGGGDKSGGGFSSQVAGLISAMGTVAMVIAACVLLAGVGFYIARKGFKMARQQQREADYEDFDEDLERPRGRLFRRLRERFSHQRISDFSDPAMKVRFAFQQLLKQKTRQGGAVFHKTPNELLDASVPGEASLVDAYNRVKYANSAATAEDAAAAERYVKNL